MKMQCIDINRLRNLILDVAVPDGQTMKFDITLANSKGYTAQEIEEANRIIQGNKVNPNKIAEILSNVRFVACNDQITRTIFYIEGAKMIFVYLTYIGEYSYVYEEELIEMICIF